MNAIPLIDKAHPWLSISQQCSLLRVNRSCYYYIRAAESPLNLELTQLMDEHYLQHPYKGVPGMHVWLTLDKGYAINIKQVGRLYYKVMGLRALLPGQHTSKRHKEHPVFPYLLKNLQVTRPSQVWTTDLSYIPMLHGYLYLMAIINVYSRYIVNWDISNTMDAKWCADLITEGFAAFGKPLIINTDQGAQFTSAGFTTAVLGNGIKLSMDGKGSAIDNIFIERFWSTIKYDHIYLNPTNDGKELYKGIQTYINFYNMERRHESLTYTTHYSHYKPITS